MPVSVMSSISKVADLAIFSSGSDGNGTLPPGWVQIPVPLPDDSARTGFSVITYKNVATEEVAVAFRGTSYRKDITGSDTKIATYREIDSRGTDGHAGHSRALVLAKNSNKRYHVDSCLRLKDKGRMPFSCVKRQR